MRRLREVVLIVFGAMGILALARQALDPGALEAVAIPNAQEDVDIDSQNFSNTFTEQTSSLDVALYDRTTSSRVAVPA